MSKESAHNRRKHDWQPFPWEVPIIKEQPYQKPWIKEMTQVPDRDKGLYKLRKQTVEPVFGIVIQTLGFRLFIHRGLRKTNLEWTLVAYTHNLKRLAVLQGKRA